MFQTKFRCEANALVLSDPVQLGAPCEVEISGGSLLKNGVEQPPGTVYYGPNEVIQVRVLSGGVPSITWATLRLVMDNKLYRYAFAAQVSPELEPRLAEQYDNASQLDIMGVLRTRDSNKLIEYTAEGDVVRQRNLVTSPSGVVDNPFIGFISAEYFNNVVSVINGSDLTIGAQLHFPFNILVGAYYQIEVTDTSVSAVLLHPGSSEVFFLRGTNVVRTLSGLDGLRAACSDEDYLYITSWAGVHKYGHGLVLEGTIPLPAGVTRFDCAALAGSLHASSGSTVYEWNDVSGAWAAIPVGGQVRSMVARGVVLYACAGSSVKRIENGVVTASFDLIDYDFPVSVAASSSGVAVCCLNTSKIVILDESLNPVDEWPVSGKPWECCWFNGNLLVSLLWNEVTPDLTAYRDLAPDNLSIAHINSVPLDFPCSTFSRALTGLADSVLASASPILGTGFSVNGVRFDEPTPVGQGDVVQIDFGAVPEEQIVEYKLVVGESEYVTQVNAVQPSSDPDGFNFTDVSDCVPGVLITSNEITVSGAQGTLTLATTALDIVLNDVSLSNTVCEVQNGDRVKLVARSSNTAGDSRFIRVMCGGYEEVWTISTAVSDRRYLWEQYFTSFESVAGTGSKSVVRISEALATERSSLDNPPTGLNQADGYALFVDRKAKVLHAVALDDLVVGSTVSIPGILSAFAYPKVSTGLPGSASLVVTSGTVQKLSALGAAEWTFELPAPAVAADSDEQGRLCVVFSDGSVRIYEFNGLGEAIMDQALTGFGLASPDFATYVGSDLYLGSSKSRKLVKTGSTFALTGIVPKSVRSCSTGLLVVDVWANRVLECTLDLQTVSQIELGYVPSAAVELDSARYVSDLENGRVVKYDLAWSEISSVHTNDNLVDLVVVRGSLIGLELYAAATGLTSRITGATVSFQSRVGLTPDSIVRSEDSVVSGMVRPYPIKLEAFSNARLYVDQVLQPSGTAVVWNGQSVSIEVDAASSFWKSKTVGIASAERVSNWIIWTKAQLYPNELRFAAQYHKLPGEYCLSDPLIISGVSEGFASLIRLELSVPTKRGQFILNGVAAGAECLVAAGDSIQIEVFQEGTLGMTSKHRILAPDEGVYCGYWDVSMVFPTGVFENPAEHYEAVGSLFVQRPGLPTSGVDKIEAEKFSLGSKTASLNQSIALQLGSSSFEALKGVLCAQSPYLPQTASHQVVSNDMARSYIANAPKHSVERKIKLVLAQSDLEWGILQPAYTWTADSYGTRRDKTAQVKASRVTPQDRKWAKLGISRAVEWGEGAKTESRSVTSSYGTVPTLHVFKFSGGVEMSAPIHLETILANYATGLPLAQLELDLAYRAALPANTVSIDTTWEKALQSESYVDQVFDRVGLSGRLYVPAVFALERSAFRVYDALGVLKAMVQEAAVEADDFVRSWTSIIHSTSSGIANHTAGSSSSSSSGWSAAANSSSNAPSAQPKFAVLLVRETAALVPQWVSDLVVEEPELPLVARGLFATAEEAQLAGEAETGKTVTAVAFDGGYLWTVQPEILLKSCAFYGPELGESRPLAGNLQQGPEIWKAKASGWLGGG